MKIRLTIKFFNQTYVLCSQDHVEFKYVSIFQLNRLFKITIFEFDHNLAINTTKHERGHVIQDAETFQNFTQF